MDLPVSLILHRHKGGSPLAVSLVHRKINPPLFSLIDVPHHQLSPYILGLIAVRRGFSQVYQCKGLGALRDKLGLVGPQLKDMLLPLPVRIAHDGPLKFPPIHRNAVTAHILQANALHLPGYHLPGFPLRS